LKPSSHEQTPARHDAAEPKQRTEPPHMSAHVSPVGFNSKPAPQRHRPALHDAVGPAHGVGRTEHRSTHVLSTRSKPAAQTQ
jgi:hypothetical protein